MRSFTFLHSSKMGAHSARPLTNICISSSFGVVKFCSLREEGRRDWEGKIKNVVRMKHV